MSAAEACLRLRGGQEIEVATEDEARLIQNTMRWEHSLTCALRMVGGRRQLTAAPTFRDNGAGDLANFRLLAMREGRVI